MLLALCEGNPPVTSGFPSQSQWRGSFWTNGWDSGNLRRHCAHWDVTVLKGHTETQAVWQWWLWLFWPVSQSFTRKIYVIITPYFTCGDSIWLGEFPWKIHCACDYCYERGYKYMRYLIHTVIHYTTDTAEINSMQQGSFYVCAQPMRDDITM